jgi:microcystin-dependent protein
MPLKNGRTTASLQTVLVGSVIPAGTIAPFGGGTVPTGWLLCDGSTVSRTTYPNLFAAVGTLHGQGDGSTTFHLPDYRGRFLRGADNMGTGAAGRDADAGTRTAPNTGGATGSGVGSVQSEATASHRHWVFANVGSSNQTMSGTTYTAFRSVGGLSGYDYWHGNTTTDCTLGLSSNSTTGTLTETRPQNANVEYIIKV